MNINEIISGQLELKNTVAKLLIAVAEEEVKSDLFLDISPFAYDERKQLIKNNFLNMSKRISQSPEEYFIGANSDSNNNTVNIRIFYSKNNMIRADFTVPVAEFSKINLDLIKI